MGLLDPVEPTGHRDAAFGLLEREGRVLLARNPRPVGGRTTPLWDLPGGGVRPDEGLVEGLRREWAEEVRLDPRVEDLLLVVDGVKRRAPKAGAIYTWRAFVFSVACEGEPACGPGIDEVAFVDRDEALRRLSAPYHEPLRVLLAGGTRRYRRVTWIDPLPEDATVGAGRAGERRRRLLVLAAAAAAGRPDLARREAEALRADGEPPSRIEEALLQVVPYAGFPRAIAAFTAVRDVLGDPGPHAPPGPERGEATFEAVYGESAPRVGDGLERLHPTLRRWTLDFAYGQVLARPRLTLLERELLAVAILTAMGGLEDPLLGHMRAALRLGATRDDVEAAIAVVPPDVGEAHRMRARTLLPRLLGPAS